MAVGAGGQGAAVWVVCVSRRSRFGRVAPGVLVQKGRRKEGKPFSVLLKLCLKPLLATVGGTLSSARVFFSRNFQGRHKNDWF